MLLLEIEIDVKYLLEAAMLFTLAAGIILVFIVFSLIVLFRQKRRNRHLRTIFSDLISEIVICESEEELQATIAKPFIQTIIRTTMCDKKDRCLLILELVKVSRSLAGDAGGNVRWLYNELGLDKDTVRDLEKGRWYLKAQSIQVLAEMKQEKYIRRIYKRINNRNSFVHAEAQVALVKLLQFEGLRFLNLIDQPISQWQQLRLLNQLPDFGDIETGKIENWLHSNNLSVIEFALRLAAKYKLYEFHDQALMLLQHENESIRNEAAGVLIEINNDTTVDRLISVYDRSSDKTRLLILQLVSTLGTNEQLPFFEQVAARENSALQAKALRMIELMTPAQ
jgi:hypothetical protein